MRRRWVQFDWSIAVVLSAALHIALVWWILHEQINALALMLARSATSSWVLRDDERDEHLSSTLGS